MWFRDSLLKLGVTIPYGVVSQNMGTLKDLATIKGEHEMSKH